MKQLYYTSCREGFSYNGRDGFNIRSMSPGFGAGEREEAITMAYYVPPVQGMAAAQAPVRLAWVKGADTNRYLVHAAYVGADPRTQRPGVGFAHLIVSDETSPITLKQAIDTWDSPEWTRADGDYSSELPDLVRLPRATGELTLQRLYARYSYGRARELLLWTVDAWLHMATQSSGFDRLIVEGEAQDLAWMVFALAHLLPGKFTAALTFSTYESAPPSSKASMVGAYVSQDRVADPDANFASGLCCFNVPSGRHTPVPECAFRRPLEAALDAGNLVPLGEVARIMEADMQGHPDPRALFDSYWAVHGGASLNGTTFLMLAGARSPSLKRVLAQASTAEYLAQAFQNTSAPPQIPSGFIASLPPEVQANLHQRLRQVLHTAVAEGRLDLASHLLQTIPFQIPELDKTSLLGGLTPLMPSASVSARLLVYTEFKALSRAKQGLDWLVSAPPPQLESLICASPELSQFEKARLIWHLPPEIAANILARQSDLLQPTFRMAAASEPAATVKDKRLHRLTALLKACAASGVAPQPLASLMAEPELRKVQLEVLAQVQPQFGRWTLPQLNDSDLTDLLPRPLELVLRNFYKEASFEERGRHEARSEWLRQFLMSKGIDVPDPFSAMLEPLRHLTWETADIPETVGAVVQDLTAAGVAPASIQLEVGRALVWGHFASQNSTILHSIFQQLQEAQIVAAPASPYFCKGLLAGFLSWEDHEKWRAVDHLGDLLILVFQQMAPIRNAEEPLIIDVFQEMKASKRVSREDKRFFHTLLDLNLTRSAEKKVLRRHRSRAFPSSGQKLFAWLCRRFRKSSH